MRPQTLVRWLMHWAETDPARVAVVSRDGLCSYGELAEAVQERAEELSSDVPIDRAFPVRVTLDTATIVEMLAVQAGGGVPLPFTADVPRPTGVPGPLDVIAVQTSGSSGAPRTVRLTDTNIEASVVASRVRHATSATDCWLLCLPLNHVGGLSVLWRSLESGGSVALAPFDDDLPAFMATAKPTVASMVPTMVHRLVESDPSVLAALRFVLVGGAAISDDLVRRADNLGVTIVQTYGMTETASQVATAQRSTSDAAEILGTDSQAVDAHGAEVLDGFGIEITDRDGLAVPVGVTGLITVDGPAVSPGYLGKAERSGAFNTMDLGYLRPDGSVVVVGRADDIVITGGENVSLARVSSAVANFEGVADAVAMGFPDQEWGVAIAAIVATELAADVLAEAARLELPRHACPRRWIIVDDIPLLENGKHDLEAVRALAAADLGVG